MTNYILRLEGDQLNWLAALIHDQLEIEEETLKDEIAQKDYESVADVVNSILHLKQLQDLVRNCEREEGTDF